jgi:hypothetical protein
MSDVPRGPDWWQASDGRWYAPPRPAAAPPPPVYRSPPQLGYGAPLGYGPPPGYVPPPPASSSGTNVLLWVLVAIGVAGLLGLGACVVVFVSVGEAAREMELSAPGEADDITATRCRTDAGEPLAAEVEVTNDSSERSNYGIDVVFESAGGDQIETAFGFVSALEPGQSRVIDVQTVTSPPAAGVTCRVTDVERFSDEP